MSTPLTPLPAFKEAFFASSPRRLGTVTPLLSQQPCRLRASPFGRSPAEIFLPEPRARTAAGWQRSTEKLRLTLRLDLDALPFNSPLNGPL